MKITAAVERRIEAPAGRVYHYLRDFREHHPRFLPPQFSNFRVHHGGIGAGTIHSFDMTLAGRTTSYEVRVGEPEPGRVLIESDRSRRMLTTFTVDATPEGDSIVRIETAWHTNGFAALVERVLAPRMLKRVYRAELNLLDRYAREHVPTTKPGMHAGRGVVVA